MTTPMTPIFSPRYRRGFCSVAPRACVTTPETSPNRRPRGVWLAALLSGRSEKTFRAKARAKRKERMTPYFSPR